MKQLQQEVIEQYVAAYNTFDTEGMGTNLHEDVVFENLTHGKTDLRTEGLTAFLQQAEAAKAYFRQRKQTILNWHFDGSSVSIDIGYEATLDMDLPNGMKSGDVLKLSGKSTFEFRDLKIVKITDES